MDHLLKEISANSTNLLDIAVGLALIAYSFYYLTRNILAMGIGLLFLSFALCIITIDNLIHPHFPNHQVSNFLFAIFTLIAGIICISLRKREHSSSKS